MGSSLEEKKVPLDPLLWAAGCVIDNPDAIKSVHSDFLKSGANIITTASYQMSFDGLSRNGVVDSEAVNLFQRSTDLALYCCGRCRAGTGVSSVIDSLSTEGSNDYDALVATSIGCYGATLANGCEYSSGGYGLTAKQLRG